MKWKVFLFILIIFSFSIGYTSSDKWLTYTTVGDDGNVGIADGYVVKISHSADSLENHWDACTTLFTILNTSGKPAGVLDSILVPFSTYPDGNYFLSMKAFDDAMNFSAFGNVAEEVIDNTPPATVNCFIK